MTDRDLAGCALLPCNFPCEKCGSTDIARAFRPSGDKWKVEIYGKAASKYAYADAYVATCSRDHINHRCRCCQHEWQTLPMKKQKKSRAPSRDAVDMWREAFRHRVFNEHIQHGSPITVAHASACTAVSQVEAGIRVAIAAADGENHG